jgi:hypothetical protein
VHEPPAGRAEVSLFDGGVVPTAGARSLVWWDYIDTGAPPFARGCGGVRLGAAARGSLTHSV